MELNVFFTETIFSVIGYLLGIGETSCDIDTFFQGSADTKGLITLSVNNLLQQVNQVKTMVLFK